MKRSWTSTGLGGAPSSAPFGSVPSLKGSFTPRSPSPTGLPVSGSIFTSTMPGGGSKSGWGRSCRAPDGAGVNGMVAARINGELAEVCQNDFLPEYYNEIETDSDFNASGTVVLPASAGTVGALATGVADTLVHRAGAVALKERWPLLLGFRETPLSLVHLENLRALTYAGATVVPPLPAFYLGGEDLERFVDAYCQRLLDHLGLGSEGPGLRWPI